MQRGHLDDLVAFVAVGRERSFTKAAAKLGVSQSALSHTIRELEARLGVRLLTRTTRSVSPTDAGERLLHTLGPRFEEIETELAAIGELREKPAGTIRITATEYTVDTLLWPKLAKFLSRYPDIKVVILSMNGEPEQMQAAFRCGACGYVLKGIAPRDLVSAIRQAVDGTAFHAQGLPAVTDGALIRAAGLTEREAEILRLVARGLSNREIARELWVTEPTVKFHLTRLYRKLGVTSRTAAARWAFAKGLAADTAGRFAGLIAADGASEPFIVSQTR